MTIDNMLSEVAKIIGETTAKESLPQKSAEAKLYPPKAGNKSKVQLNTKPLLGLALAKEIAYCIEKTAEHLGINVVITIADDSGSPIFLEVMDGSLPISVKASREKAYTSAVLRMPTHEALAAARGGDLDGLTNSGGILMLGGGYPIITGGTVIGSIGVSGGTKDQDTALAKAGTMYFDQRIKMLK